MIYKGYKIRVRCIEWEQVKEIGAFWDLFTENIKIEKLIGLGMNWSNDYLYFDYAIGTIEDEETLDKIKEINFSKYNIDSKYIELKLPNIDEWEIFKGKEKNLKELYEQEIDCNNKKYNYELEYFDGNGNVEIKIHYI